METNALEETLFVLEDYHDETVGALETAYQDAIAQRDSLPTQESYDALEAAYLSAAAERDALPAQESYDALEAAYAATVLERDSRPTQAAYQSLEDAYTTALSERDARFTEDQIRALSADYTVGLNQAGNVQLKFNLFESNDLNTFSPFTILTASRSYADSWGDRARDQNRS